MCSTRPCGPSTTCRTLQLLPSTGVSSAELDIPRLAVLAEQLEGHVDAGASGVVVTTGTDTLEEVAFVLDLLWARDEPLVVVGAMRHGALPGSDGPANLRDGLRVAAHPHARGQGVLVVMGGEIHQAWQVRKCHSGALSAFTSAVSGPAGAVQEDTVRMTSPSVIDRPLFTLSPPTATEPVALVQSALGDDGRILSLITAAGYRGLVIEALGGGSVPPAWVAGLEQLVRVIPVAYSPRTFAGSTLRSTYGSPGAELDLRRMGIIPTGLLDSLKSRLLLQLLLTIEADASARERAFAMFDQPRATGNRRAFLTGRSAATDTRLAR